MKVNKGLRIFSKLTALSTLFLIFVGGMVTSTGSGLSVPDWPLSYGTLFPPMVGGIFYEHGHRMVASVVGLMTLILAVWLHFSEERFWVKAVGYCALGAVICQGVLGGITVLFYLPTAVSVSHGVLAQTFFLLTIFLAYSQSRERSWRSDMPVAIEIKLQRGVFMLCCIVYVQLIFGAIMRHTGSGLAVYDFPTMAGQWWPTLNDQFLSRVNDWRFEHTLDFVAMSNVVFHLIHRFGAVVVCLAVVHVNVMARKCALPNIQQIKVSLWMLNIMIIIQVLLGVTSVLTLKAPTITSLHVMGGASILGFSFLLLLLILPVSKEDVRWS